GARGCGDHGDADCRTVGLSLFVLLVVFLWLVVFFGLRWLARREIVDVREIDVRRVSIFERERASGRLEGNRPARALGVLLVLLRAAAALRFGVGPEIAAPPRCSAGRSTRVERTRPAVRRRGSRAKAAGARSRRPARPSVFACARFADG